MRRNAAAISRLFAGQRHRLAVGLALSILQALALLPIALLVKHLFGDAIPERDDSAILLDGAAILGLYVVAAVLQLLSARAVMAATAASSAALRTAVLDRLHSLPMRWHDTHGAAELQSDVVAQAERVENLGQPLVTLGQAVVVGPPLVVLAIVVSPLLAAIAFVAVPMLIFAGVLVRRRLIRDVRVWHAAVKRFGGHLGITLRTMALIRSRSADADELARGEELVEDLADGSLARSRSQNAFGVLQGAVAAVAGSLILAVGGIEVAHGSLALEDLLAFYAVIGLLLRTVAGGSGASALLIATLVSLHALHRIVDDPATPPYVDTDRRVPRLGTLSLRGVTFGYGDAPVLQDIDLELHPGEHLALVGPNGAGKSTVVALLLGLHRPWSGTVSADGVPYDELDVTALRRRIGYLPQEPTLRPGTVADNIAFGRPEAGEEDVRYAADLAAATGLGLGTELGDDGIGLSGGERQRVALARALVGDPELLILDEPTNHLDAAAVSGLLATLDALDPRPAVLVITHQPEVAEWAHHRIVMDGGRITETSLSR